MTSPLAYEMMQNIVSYCGTQKQQRAVLFALARCGKAYSLFASSCLWSTTTMRVTAENCHRLLCLVVSCPKLAERLRSLQLTVMPEDRRRARTMLQTDETLEKVRQRTEAVAGCMKQKDKNRISEDLIHGVPSMIARSILLYTPNLIKLWIVGSGAFQHHERDISAWANTLKELPRLRRVHAIDTDFLNLVPFMGGASIQAIQAQMPHLDCNKEATRVRRMNSMLAQQTNIFSSLRMLELSHLTRNRFSIAEMTQVLSQCTQLKYLALWFGRDHQDLQDREGYELISMIAESPSVESIQSLSLAAFSYQGQPCAQLLARFTVLKELDIPIQVFTDTGKITEEVLQAIPQQLQLLSLTGLAHVQQHAVRQDGRNVYQHFRGSAHALCRSLRTVFLSFDDVNPPLSHEEWSRDGYEVLDPHTCNYNAKRARRESQWMDGKCALKIPSMRARELETAALVYRASLAETTETDDALEIYVCTKEGGSSSKTATPISRI